jgi:hypothetical protein
MTKNICVIWKIEFKILPLPSHDEIIDGIKFSRNNELVEVIVSKNLSEYTEKNGYYLIPSPQYEYAQKIRDLILIKAIHNCIFEPIEVEPIRDAKICNKEHLEGLGIRIRTPVNGSINFGYHIFEENNYFSEANEYWRTGFLKSTKGHQDDILEISRWIVMAQEEESEIKGFIILYIAFNYLYSHYSRRIKKVSDESPNNEIRTTIYYLLAKKQLNEVFELNKNNFTFQTLASFDIKKNDNKKPDCSENLSLTLKSVFDKNCDQKVVVYKAALCVHQIRNDLFHYGIGMSNSFRKANVGKFFLITLLPRLLRNFIEYK